MYMIIKEEEEEEEKKKKLRSRIHQGLGQRLSWDTTFPVSNTHDSPLSSPHIPMSMGLDGDYMSV